MNRVFDPQTEKEHLLEIYGIQRSRSQSLEAASSKGAVTSTVRGILYDAMRCVIVGFDYEARELLGKAVEWLGYAIEAGEKPYFQYGTEALRHENLAICNWLLTNEHDQRNLNEAVRYEELYENSTKPDKVAASIVLPVYIDARHYTEALVLFEKYWGQKRPANVKRMTGEGGMSYIIAASKLRNEYTAEQVHLAGESFLRANMAKFLQGHYITAARWLKILHWNDVPNPSSAFETVRRCYDYLPGVERPEFS